MAEETRYIGNNRHKISLRHAARAGHTSHTQRRRIFCGRAGSCQSARCVCYKAGVKCTIYCHKRTGECPNKATSSAYNHMTVIEQVCLLDGGNEYKEGRPLVQKKLGWAQDQR